MIPFIRANGYLWYAGPDAVENLPTGDHELHIIERLKAIFRHAKNDLLIDVGAHYGLYSIHLAQYFRTVWSFEPHPHNYQILVKNIEANRMTNIIAHQIALWDTDGEVTLAVVPGNRVEDTSGRYMVQDNVPGVTVPARRLDSLRPTRITFLKIDVEGQGHHVLAGAIETLHKYRPMVQVEFHSQAEIQNCEQILEGLGYTELLRFPYPPHHLSIFRLD